jgi:O-antigen/teichoic acid export membrane protein
MWARGSVGRRPFQEPEWVVTAPEDTADRYDGALKRGALFNLLGGLARLIQPAYVLVISWLWGPAFAGLYLLAHALTEIVSGVIVAGYADATMVFASRHTDAAAGDVERRRALYHVLANTFAFSVGLALLAAVGAQLGARALVEHVFPGYRALLPGLYLLAWSLVPRSALQIAIAATRATLRMQYDALLNGLVHPLCMLLGCLATYALGGQLTELLAVQLLVDSVVCLLGLGAFARHFALRELIAALRAFGFDREVLAFAVPQSLNLTFNRYITRLDGIMLAAFGLGQAELGYFSTAALLTSNIGQIRLVFSGALAPVVARFHSGGERLAFQDALSRVTRWTTSLVVPVILVLLVLREDILRLVSHEYGKHSEFVAVLLIPPFTNCAYGMAGACLMFTGHSRVILANSFCVAILNTAFTYLLIPRYGMMGAAVATALATSITTGLQVLELRRLERVLVPWRAVWKPHLGLLAGLSALLLVWDPVALPLMGRLTAAAGLVVGYAVLMLLLDHEELTRFTRRHDHQGAPD